MKNITKFTCLALGAGFIATAVPAAFSGTAPSACCGAMTPMADEAKPDAKAKGIRKEDFEQAMERLFTAGRIRLEPHGRADRSRLVEAS